MIGLENSVKGGKKVVHRKAQVEKTTSDELESLASKCEDNDAESESNGDSGDDKDDYDDYDDDGGTTGKEGSVSYDVGRIRSKANPGWADVMQKILNAKKPKKKKTIVLSKAKKLSQVKLKVSSENIPFEIEIKNGETSERIPPKMKMDKDNCESTAAKRRRKEIQLGIRIKPSILDGERERSLRKIATKGVVQLFNVVKQQQTEITKKLIEAGPLEKKRERVPKSIDKQVFLDVLMGGSKNVSLEDRKNENDNVDKVWSVLRDDFVMGAKLKDWDKKVPNDEDSTSTEGMDSD